MNKKSSLEAIISLLLPATQVIYSLNIKRFVDERPDKNNLPIRTNIIRPRTNYLGTNAENYRNKKEYGKSRRIYSS
jgi:hypothetical protein